MFVSSIKLNAGQLRYHGWMMFLLNSVPIAVQSQLTTSLYVISPGPRSFFDAFTLEICSKSTLKCVNIVVYEYFDQIYFALTENERARVLLNGPLFTGFLLYALCPFVEINFSLR